MCLAACKQGLQSSVNTTCSTLYSISCRALICRRTQQSYRTTGRSVTVSASPKTLKSSLQGLRGAVQQALQLVPESSLVGLVTFGATVQGARAPT